MATLFRQVGKEPSAFTFKPCRMERRGYLSLLSYGIDDRDERYEMMHRREAVIVLPVDFGKREVYVIEQPRFIRAFKENEAGNRALNAAMSDEDVPSFDTELSRLMTMEFPAGLIDDGETALHAATRELFEETGIGIPEESFEKIATYYTSIGGSDERLTSFFAHLDDGATFDTPPGDGHEIIRTWKMSWDEAFALFREGRIIGASTRLLMLELMLRDCRK